jgi:hypothetical protein
LKLTIYQASGKSLEYVIKCPIIAAIHSAGVAFFTLGSALEESSFATEATLVLLPGSNCESELSHNKIFLLGLLFPI